MIFLLFSDTWRPSAHALILRKPNASENHAARKAARAGNLLKGEIAVTYQRMKKSPRIFGELR
ncbi:MAG: hypothetical protein KGQ79_03375 [Proteobacteria bacterium]|nr:hypothetical protein [Pseudomonadota bacterium]